MKYLSCLFLLLLCACATADPYTAQQWANGAINATNIAVVSRAQEATAAVAGTQEALTAKQTQMMMDIQATKAADDYASTRIAAQHTAVMDALRATQDRYVAGLQQDARINEEWARQTQSALVATATQGAIVSATTRTSAVTSVFVYVLWSVSCLSSLAVFALISVKWYRSVREIERLVYQPRMTAPVVSQITPVSESQPNIQAADDTVNEVAKIILQSAYQNGWDSNEIVGHRDLEIGAGKWHRLISSIRGYVDTSNQGTRIINGTLREFYAELEAGAITITHPAA